jgi:hypothetical protein
VSPVYLGVEVMNTCTVNNFSSLFWKASCQQFSNKYEFELIKQLPSHVH